MLVDLGTEPHNKNATFTVSAAVYSEKENTYIHKWPDKKFPSYDAAYEYWDRWNPKNKELTELMKKRRADGDMSHHELEICIISSDPNETSDLAFFNKTLDEEHENV